MDWYGNFPSRRRVEGGIKAKSARGDIGETWWSKRFTAVLESFHLGGRLQRGRSYARSGQVMSLSVDPGRVVARVQGSRARPYRVRIEVPVLSEEQWRGVERQMAAQALFMAKLLAGEMPRDIEEAFVGRSLTLFPAKRKDLATRCSCPDQTNPCKHIAATCYILAERFDEDPFLIFQWRGRSKEQLVEKLRSLRSPEAADPGALLPPPAPPSLAESLDDFWRAGPELTELRLDPHAPEEPAALLRQLGDLPPEVGGREATEALAAAYRIMTKSAERRARGDA